MTFRAWLDRVVRFPLTRIVLGTAAVFGALLITRGLIEHLYSILDRRLRPGKGAPAGTLPATVLAPPAGDAAGLIRGTTPSDR